MSACHWCRAALPGAALECKTCGGPVRAAAESGRDAFLILNHREPTETELIDQRRWTFGMSTAEACKALEAAMARHNPAIA